MTLAIPSSTVPLTPAVASTITTSASPQFAASVDRVTFSGLQQQAGTAAKKAGVGIISAFRQLAKLGKNSTDGRILSGVGLKYVVPSLATAALLAIPGGVLLFPFIGIPLTNRLSNRGNAIIESELTSGDEAKRSLVKRLTSVIDGLLDPEKGDGKKVIGEYNAVKDELFARLAKDPSAAKAVGNASKLDKLKAFLHLNEGSLGYKLIGKTVNAQRIYRSTAFGGCMVKLMQWGKKVKFLLPISILANAVFVAMHWKKIKI